MNLSTDDAVRAVFIEATRHTLTRSLRTSEDWDQYQSIIQETTARIEAEQTAHAHDYRDRIAEAKEIILREEHGIRLDQPLPPGVEKFSDKDALQHKAEIRVRQDYDRRIAAIRTDELDQYRDLTADIRDRDRPNLAQSRDDSRTQSRSGPSQD